VRRILTLATAATIGLLGGLGGAIAIATPAAAVAPPTVAWKSLCDAPGGNVTATFTAPAGATDDDPIWVKISGSGSERLPTTTGKRTVELKVTSFTAISATWSQDGTTFGAINAPTTYTWSAEASGCLAKVEQTATTCDNPYISLGVSNPVGAAPITVTLNGSTVTVNGGEHAGLDNTSATITWSWQSTVPNLASHGFKGSGKLEYVPPANCAAGKPGAGPIKPSEGKRRHGKGHWQHVVIIPISDGNATPAPTNGTAKGGDTLPVTGASTMLIASIGTALAFAGAGLYWVMRRRRVRFTA
jgi:LPXTG-motif cell wall-anchored protein